MRNLFFLGLFLFSSFNLHAVTLSSGATLGTIDSATEADFDPVPSSDGSDGFFDPVIDTVLTVPSDGVFNFTGINIGSGITISFDRNGFDGAIALAASDGIVIDGIINWTGTLGIISESVEINSSAELLGENGNLSIFTDNLLLDNDALISTFSDEGSNPGGDIALPSGDIDLTDLIDTTPVPLPLPLFLFASALLTLLTGRIRKPF